MNSVTFPEMIDKTTAAKLATAARQITDWTTKRDDLIREAHANGASLRDIAEHAGITHVGVMKIVKRAPGPTTKETPE